MAKTAAERSLDSRQMIRESNAPGRRLDPYGTERIIRPKICRRKFTIQNVELCDSRKTLLLLAPLHHKSV